MAPAVAAVAGLLFTIVLTQVPFVMSIWYSLTDWKVVPPGPREFVGLDNYSELVRRRALPRRRMGRASS